jgi:nardilysin
MPPQELDPFMTEKDSGIIVGPDLNPSRPQLDKKLYRQILLPNGLRALLISDVIAIHQMRNAGIVHLGHDDDDDDEEEEEEDGDDPNNHSQDKKEDAMDEGSNDDDDDESDDNDHGLRDAAAAVVVGAGSMYDPPECQGLAHFLEHLLFMGSDKYPTENAFESFLSKHGGTDNAYTELEHTVYHLEIPQEHLFEALDMLAQFFIHPLLLEDAVDRELSSIESEFQLNKNSDNCRLQQLMCHTCGYDATTHPFAKFAWGNRKSLQESPALRNVNVMEMLRSFYHQVRCRDILYPVPSCERGNTPDITLA